MKKNLIFPLLLLAACGNFSFAQDFVQLETTSKMHFRRIQVTTFTEGEKHEEKVLYKNFKDRDQSPLAQGALTPVQWARIKTLAREFKDGEKKAKRKSQGCEQNFIFKYSLAGKDESLSGCYSKDDDPVNTLSFELQRHIRQQTEF